jgi:hypothetical protein
MEILMEYKNEHQRQMAILEAASPYVTPANRHAIELLLQADSLVQLAQHRGGNDLEAAENKEQSAPFQPNPQEMLLNIQRFLTPMEAEVVQTILNFMNAQKLFQNYSEFVRTHSDSVMAAGTDSSQQNMLQAFLLSQLNPEQKATFEQLQNIMYNE